MSDDERIARYGRAIWHTNRADEGTISYIGANKVAAAVIEVADEESAEAHLTLDRVWALLPRFADQGMPDAAEQLREALDGKGAGPARSWRRYVDDGGPARNALALSELPQEA